MSMSLILKGISRLTVILGASLTVACGQVDLTGRDNTVSQPPEGGFGTLKLSSEQFPEGAESLTLAIIDTAPGGDFDCHKIQPLPAYDSTSSGVEGLGLRSLPVPDWNECLPVLYNEDHVNSKYHDNFAQPARIIQVRRGEEITPIRLRAGSYQAQADFFDKTGELLYTGSEVFDIQDGEQKAITIRLKKIESGEVTIDFEVEKPIVTPQRISAGAHLELRMTNGSGPFGSRSKFIDLDMEKGVALVADECPAIKGSLAAIDCMNRKVSLSRRAIKEINTILDQVSLKSVSAVAGIDQLCAKPVHEISLVLKKCDTCEAGEIYHFSNLFCGQARHNLTSEQFERIWQLVQGRTNLPLPVTTQGR